MSMLSQSTLSYLLFVSELFEPSTPLPSFDIEPFVLVLCFVEVCSLGFLIFVKEVGIILMVDLSALFFFHYLVLRSEL